MDQIIYHYLVMAQKDLLENQCLEEILREKSTYYSIRKKQRDFWLSISPKFLYQEKIFHSLKLTKFYQQKKSILSTSLIENSNNTNFFASFISLDKEFINWLQLRLGYFENIDEKNFLTNLKTKNFVSDGIKGTLILSKKENILNPLKNSSNYIHPDIFLKKNQKFLELYYKTFSNNELDSIC
jgi:hypothetical protein